MTRRRRPWVLRLVALSILAFLAALVTWYRLATSPAQLRARLARQLSGLGNLRFDASDLAFSLNDGLTLYDFVIRAATETLPAALDDPGDAELVRAAQVRVRFDRWLLLAGRFRATDIEADGVRVRVLRDQDSGALNWPLGAGGDGGGTGFDPADLAPLRARAADLNILSISGGRRRIVKRSVCDVSAEPAGGSYRVRVSGAGSAEHEVARLEWDWGRREWRIDFDWIDVDVGLALAPDDWGRQIERLGLAARVRAQEVRLRGRQPVGGRLEFAEVACAPPAETEAALAAGERFAQIRAARGRIEFAPAAIAVTADGMLNGGDARLEATLATSLETGPREFDARLTLRDAPLPDVDGARDRRFLDGLPNALRQFFADYVPRGRFDMDVRVTRSGSAGVHYEGLVTFREGKCRYFRFPYDFDQVNGSVTFSPRGMDLIDLTGRHGSARVALTGHVNNTTSWTGFAVQVRATDVPLDAALYDALPAKDQRVWDEADPRGLADLEVHLERPDGTEADGPPHTAVRVDARLRSGSVALGDRRRLTHAEGRMTISGGRMTIHTLSGLLDTAPITLEGEVIEAPDDSPPAVSLRVRGDQVPISHRVALADSGPAVSFVGVGEVWGRFERGAGGESGDHYVVRVLDGSLASAGGAPWTQVRGWLVRTGDELEVRELAAQRGPEWVEFSGRLLDRDGLPSTADRGLQLAIRAGDVDLERAATEWLPEPWRDAGRRIGLRGLGRVSVTVNPRSDGAADPHAVVDVRIEAPLARPAPLPLDFRDVSASVTIDSTRCQVHLATGRVGTAGTVRAAGLGNWTDGAESMRMSLSAQDLDLNTELIRALPKDLRELLFRMAAAGQADLELADLRYDARDGSWHVGGTVRLREARMDVGAVFADCTAEISGEAVLAGDGTLTLDAAFTIERGTFHGRPIARWEGRLERLPGDDVLQVRDVRGRFCDGEMVGSARYDARQGDYEASMTLSDVDFARFLDSAPDGADAGRLDGYLFLLGGGAQRTGGGNLRIRGGSFMRTPLLTGVLREARRGGAVADVVNATDVQFVMEGDTFHLTRVDVQSRDLRLVGQGDWDSRSGSINLTLVGAHPRHWPRVAVLTDLLESAGREFAQYRVTGPARDPRVTMEPLHNWTEPLRKLLSP